MDRFQQLFKALDISDVVNDAQVRLVGIITGWVGAAISTLYGSANTIWITVLMTIVVLDWIAGSVAAKKDGTYSSQYGIEGIARTTVLFLLPCFGHFLDIGLQLPNLFFFMFTGGLTYHIFNSFTANCARAGWDKWIPNKLLKSVASEIEAKVSRAENRKRER